MIVLGIETSCDETAVALVEDGRKVLLNLVYSQIAKHRQWGGVIPELASRLHLETINLLLKEAHELVPMKEVDLIGVTQGPGLLGSLLIGMNTAKTLAWVHDKPLVAVNHLHGHVCANFIDSDLEPPFLCLLASGGHTQIIRMDTYTDFKILGETVDDAAGEAFDKVARLMDLPYPGGPHLDKLAQTLDNNFPGSMPSPHGTTALGLDQGVVPSYHFPVAKVEGLDFSFSGLKTAVLRFKQKISDNEWQVNKAHIAKAFQDCVAKTFLEKVKKAAQDTGLQQIVLAGGVAANSAIRKIFQQKFADSHKLIFPPLKYCTDNAVMIASAAYFLSQNSLPRTDFALEPYSRI